MRLLLLILLLLVFQSHAQKTIDVKEKILAADKKLEKIKNPEINRGQKLFTIK